MPLHRHLAAVLVATFGAAPAGAQAETLLAVLESFPDDDLPDSIHGLSGPHHDASVGRLAALGERAHPFLIGALRAPHSNSKSFSAAFADFDQRSAWAIPALLDCLQNPTTLFVTLGLLERLGAAAQPALPYLRAHGAEQARALAARMQRGNATPIRMPRRASIDPRWTEPLLGVLRDEASRARWWPALQALCAIDDDAAARGAIALAVHATVRDDTQAIALLETLRCWFARHAILDVRIAAELPATLRSRELRRCVLARPVPRASDGDEALTALATDADAEVRRLAVLGAVLMRLRTGDARPYDWLSELERDADQEVRELALAVAHRDRSAADALFAIPLDATSDLATIFRRYEGLAGERLRALPPARLKELLSIVPPIEGGASAPEDPGLSQALIRAAERSARRDVAEARGARALLTRLLQHAPDVVLALGEPTETERRTLDDAMLRSERLAPALHGWLIDRTELGRRNRPHLPITLAPELRRRLADPDRSSRALALLCENSPVEEWKRHLPSMVDEVERRFWEFADGARLDAARLLVNGGESGQRAVERLLVLEDLSPEMLEEIVKRLRWSASHTPPRPAFILELLASPRRELRDAGCNLAPYAQREREAIADAILARMDDPDDAMPASVSFALGRLGQRIAVPKLEVRFGLTTGKDRLETAVAILALDAGHTGARTFLEEQLASDDEAAVDAALSSISRLPKASAVFMDYVVEQFDAQGISDFRIGAYSKLITSAASVRPEDVRERLETLTRHPDRRVSQEAEHSQRFLEQRR